LKLSDPWSIGRGPNLADSKAETQDSAKDARDFPPRNSFTRASEHMISL
jgi:hypothetical protein